MATVIDTSDVTGKPQNKPVIPKTKLTWRILNAEFRTSAAGNKMVLLTEEIAAPDSIKVGDHELKIAGLQTTDCIVFFDGPGSERSKNRFKSLNQSVKHPGGDKVDIEDPTQLRHYIGKAVYAHSYTESKVDIDEVTKQPMLDGEGHPIINNNYRITAYVGANDEFTIPAENVAY